MLSKLPEPGSLTVEVHDGALLFVFAEGVDFTWSPTRNTVTFHEYAPPPGAEVSPTYERHRPHQS